MYRYKLTVEYDGSKFYGFQKQDNIVTIQGVLESAVSKLSDSIVNIVGAGRTDKGVHATGQVIHFDLQRNLPAHKIQLAVNYYLKQYPISICHGENLGQNSSFHARFSAVARQYQYLILLQSYPPTFNAHLYWWHNHKLDHTLMHEAAQLLVGQHDFTSFRSSACGALSPVKTITNISVVKENNLVVINVIAPSFLHHQVRFIVGALTQIGLHKWSPSKLQEILLAKDNTKNAALAPPQGLYLTKVFY